jgi:hypothetical protein
MSISDRKKQRIYRLIAEGENLDPRDLEVFYRWVHSSYDALGFHPSLQQRFDDYCRSSGDSGSMRVYVGLWILRSSLWRDSERTKDALHGER